MAAWQRFDGLKQAGREWNVELDSFLRERDLVLLREDPCVYRHASKDLIVLVYVDNILVGYDKVEDMQELMSALHTKYDIKDLGELSWFLGMRITRDLDNGVLLIDQEQYARELCHRFAVESYRDVATPMDQSTTLYPAVEGEELAHHMPYRQAVGALMYLSRVSRPDISFAVNQAAAHSNRPSIRHWRTTASLGLCCSLVVQAPISCDKIVYCGQVHRRGHGSRRFALDGDVPALADRRSANQGPSDESLHDTKNQDGDDFKCSEKSVDIASIP
ncbi:unnamed protein product [Phytophthora lilii]|uniref:Unnamed protein product n=1 Tax=Phytophthora lilii TaxID=2077276 RepID=A0A9W7CP68_9STRA|nr:unnamed protein product [Phytophthora lilii]